MAAPNKESSLLSELQRAAFRKWRDSKNYTEVQSKSYPTSNAGGEDFDRHVNVTLTIQEDGNVDVLLNVSGRHELPCDGQLQDVSMDMPTYRDHSDDIDLAQRSFKEDSEGGVVGDANLCRPQQLYLYFLELQRLKAIKDLDPNMSSKGVSPRLPYEGGLTELQRAAFKKWSIDGKMDLNATKKFALLNLNEDSMQPTMTTLKGDANSVLEIDSMLNDVPSQ